MGKIGEQRDQEDDAERLRLVGRELEDDGRSLEMRLDDVTLDGDDVPDVRGRRAPRHDVGGAHDGDRGCEPRRTGDQQPIRNPGTHGRTALAGADARLQPRKRPGARLGERPETPSRVGTESRA